MRVDGSATKELKKKFLKLKPKVGDSWMKRYVDMFCKGQLPSQNITTYQKLLNINRKGGLSSAPSPTVLNNLKLLIGETTI